MYPVSGTSESNVINQVPAVLIDSGHSRGTSESHRNAARDQCPGKAGGGKLSRLSLLSDEEGTSYSYEKGKGF